MTHELRQKAFAEFRKLFRKNGVTLQWLTEMRDAAATCAAQAGELADCKERYLAAEKSMDDAVVELYLSADHLRLLDDAELSALLKEAGRICHLTGNFHNIASNELERLEVEAESFAHLVQSAMDDVSERPSSFEDLGITD